MEEMVFYYYILKVEMVCEVTDSQWSVKRKQYLKMKNISWMCIIIRCANAICIEWFTYASITYHENIIDPSWYDITLIYSEKEKNKSFSGNFIVQTNY